MKSIFVILLFVHGLLHVIGFLKAFQVYELNTFSQNISKPVGLTWLFVYVLFMLATLLFLIKKEWWLVIAFIAVCCSQVLIVLFWKEARFGTILNVIVLLVSGAALGHYNFNLMVKNETVDMLKNINITDEDARHELTKLPLSIQKWLNRSGIVTKEKVKYVHLKQKGVLKMKINSAWMPFTAEQYFNVQRPAFIWTTEVEMNSFVSFRGRDKLNDGEGAMLIKLFGVIPVVDHSKNVKINSGAMLRFLAEMCWFPSAALNDYVIWETFDKTSARATLTVNGNRVSGVFSFTDEGDFKSFETLRYYGGETDSKLEKWHIEAIDYKSFEGVRVPDKCKVIWKLNDGDFEWLNLEITDLTYNK